MGQISGNKMVYLCALIRESSGAMGALKGDNPWFFFVALHDSLTQASSIADFARELVRILVLPQPGWRFGSNLFSGFLEVEKQERLERVSEKD